MDLGKYRGRIWRDRREFILSRCKRRETNATPDKRVGAPKNPQNTKPSTQPQNDEKTKSEPPKLKCVVTNHIENVETLDVSWKERLNDILDEKIHFEKN